MLFDNPALRQLKQQFDDKKEKVEGVVRANDRGYGFLETADHHSYFITPNGMRSVMHGDRVSAMVEPDDRGRETAVPDKLLEQALHRFTARVEEKRGRIQVIPDSPVVRNRINAVDRRTGKDQEPLAPGDFVICNLTSHALAGQGFSCEVVELVARRDNPRLPWLVTLRSLDLPTECPPAPADLSFLEASLPREDLTSCCFVTIDSAKTRDMDDALCIERRGDGFLLKVAIADPTGYVAAGSALDAEAARRAFSIYLPGVDIPILPRELSDNLCSLVEGEDRPVLAAEIAVDASGAIDHGSVRFALATIRSRGKLVYDEVSDFLEGQGTSFAPSEEVAATLRTLEAFAHARDQYRATHAATFLNQVDYEFVLTPEGGLDHVEVRRRRIANQIIEEAMIAANLACGKLLAERVGWGVFNAHAGFDRKAEKEVVALLEEMGYEPRDEAHLRSLEGFSAIRRFANAQDSTYMDRRIRKLQDFTVISLEPAPHYALGAEYYATWTSPIRKWGDMVNHRLLKSLVSGLPAPERPGAEALAALNLARRQNRMAERDCADWLYADYLEPALREGTVLGAEVHDITRGGIRAILEDSGAMVFIPAPFLCADRAMLEIDAPRGVITNASGGVAARLGDHLSVKIFEIDHRNRSLTAALAAPLEGVLLPDPSALRHKRP
ncbi:MAG: exoribonuclease II [Succinivibrionaceae bacterium]|nr:exoribonuclease II [Succinivibrionaceae bacterium]